MLILLLWKSNNAKNSVMIERMKVLVNSLVQ